jgi:hypothetical protein
LNKLSYLCAQGRWEHQKKITRVERTGEPGELPALVGTLNQEKITREGFAGFFDASF